MIHCHAQRPCPKQLQGPQRQKDGDHPLAQHIDDVRALATTASVRLLNKKLKVFERKCEDIELTIDHLCTTAPEKQDELLAELTAMTTEKMDINSEICQVYTAAPPETQNFFEPIKLAPNPGQQGQN